MAEKTPTRRPRDRRQQILAAAATQFRQRGYHNTGITDLADAVGVRSSAALYRHFPNKQEILRAALEDASLQITSAWAEEGMDLGQLVETAAERSIQSRDAVALWATQSGHLPREDRRELFAKFTAALPPLRAAIARVRPDLSPEEVDFIAWTIGSINVSIGYHAGGLDGARLKAVLVGAAQAVCQGFTSPAPPDQSTPPVLARLTGALLPTGRREAIIVAATRLFTAHGYDAVSMEDIGAAVGTSGAAVYHHFENRAAILAAAVRRWYESLFFELAVAMNQTDDAASALNHILDQLIRISILAGQDMRGIQRHLSSLPEDERTAIRHIQAGYIQEWSALLRQVRPDLSKEESVAITHVALWTIATMVTIRPLGQRPNLPEDLRTAIAAMLGLPSPSS